MQLVIDSVGTTRCLYNETLPLHQLGHLKILRASHVEPDNAGRWWADLSPVAGPVLGPFLHRSQALQAETDWLHSHRI